MSMPKNFVRIVFHKRYAMLAFTAFTVACSMSCSNASVFYWQMLSIERLQLDLLNLPSTIHQ